MIKAPGSAGDIYFCHRLAYFPVYNVTAVTVQNATEIVEGSADIEIRNVDMPMSSALIIIDPFLLKELTHPPRDSIFCSII